MKSLNLIFVLTIILSISTSCESPEEFYERRKIHYTNVEDGLPILEFSRGVYRGHQYVRNHGIYNYSFIHDPDCPCQKEKK